MALEGNCICAKEVGEQGTPHLQGQITFARTYRLLALKKLHKLAHWEPTKCKQDRNYFRKLDSVLIRDDPVSKGQRTDLVKAMAYLREGHSLKELRSDFPSEAAKYPEFFRQIYTDYQKPVIRDLNFNELYEWQEYLLYDVFAKPVNSRRITVILDLVGGQGKTTFANWIANILPDVQIFGTGKPCDLSFAVEPTLRIALFDFTRQSHHDHPWEVLESIKDQRVWCSKYQSHTKWITHPVHVVAFTNTPLPHPCPFSADRLDLHDITPKLPDVHPVWVASQSDRAGRLPVGSPPIFPVPYPESGSD